jgi:hypothetical protein
MGFGIYLDQDGYYWINGGYVNTLEMCQNEIDDFISENQVYDEADKIVLGG